MFCTRCGKPVEAGSRFCTACGTAADDAPASSPPPAAPPQPVAAPPPMATSPAANTGNNKGAVVGGSVAGAGLLLWGLFRIAHALFGGSVPDCDDDDVIKLVREILDEHGAKGDGVEASGFAGVSYDSKVEIRSCKAMLSASGSDDDVAKITYTVEWGDKKEGKILVTITGDK